MAELTLTSPNLDESTTPVTDRLLSLRVAHALAETDVPILRTLDVATNEGVVVLRGRVRNYYERQLAYVRARRVPGVRRVTDEITVAQSQEAADGLSLLSRRWLNSAPVLQSA
ncbi:MAG: hypothetical protein C0483_22420 [Pirellula sp.]|nr:hypothetical protein [Pirellula sp.]